jgi:hypothetical protein
MELREINFYSHAEIIPSTRVSIFSPPLQPRGTGGIYQVDAKRHERSQDKARAPDKIAWSDFEQLELARRAEGRTPGVKTGVYTAVHEDFEGASNAVMASAIVLHQPVITPA